MREILFETLLESVKLIPFLFFTYLIMEYLEHKAGEKTGSMVQKAGKWGPLIGSLAGALPQCGFSAAASGLYAGRVITLGTLISIYLSTSDEMLPILLSERQSIGIIVQILLTKAGIGMLAGFVIDFMMKKGVSRSSDCVKELVSSAEVRHTCTKSHGGCGQGIFRSGIVHTLQITLFIFMISLILHFLLRTVGEDALASLIMNRPVLGPVLAGAVGLIPNCAASVAVTQLYLGGVISAGAMIAGLCTGSGVGLLVLFRLNRDKKENFTVLLLLYGIGVLAGIVIDCVM